MDDKQLLRPEDKAALGQSAAMIGELGRDVVRVVVRASPFLIRLSCVTVAAIGVSYGVIDAWHAFGADLAAAIPAAALAVVPLLFAFVSRVRWGGLMAAGMVTYFTAQLLKALPPILTQLTVVVCLAALVVSDMARRGAANEGNNEQSEN